MIALPPTRASDTEILSRECASGMPKLSFRPQKSAPPNVGFPGATLLAIIPAFAILYILVVLPLIPNDGERVENILFWPVVAGLTLMPIFWNRRRVNHKFFYSLPIVSLTAYLVFAAASVTWAYSPEFAFSRLVVQVLVVIVVALPYALPISVKYTIPGVHLCYAIALAVSAVYVLTTPASPIGHTGYFTHKQELGALSATAIILSSHELLQSGWRRFVALITLGLGFWLVFQSESKSALAFALIALPCAALILLLCKKTRLTPAFFVAAVVVASMFVRNPIERIGYRLFGDSTLTGRTAIWYFIDHQISQRPWLGWGFHSYYFVPNSPQNEAQGYVRQMPSSHSGFLELKLETGRIGYWIFLVFIYSSLYLLERVRRVAPIRAWCYLSIELFAMFINLTDSHLIVLDCVWIAYLFVIVETVHFSVQSKVRDPEQIPVHVAKKGRFLRIGPLGSRARPASS